MLIRESSLYGSILANEGRIIELNIIVSATPTEIMDLGNNYEL